jgi:beta-lactamase class A
MLRMVRGLVVTGLAAALVVLAAPSLVLTTAAAAGPIASAVAVPQPPPEPVAAREYATPMVAAAIGAAPSDLRLGVAVLDVATGELATAGGGQFYSASLSKLMLIVDLLDRDVTLTDSDLALIDRALRLSDDEAMDALWVRFDGPAAMTRVANALGMVGTQTPDDPSQWGEAVVSPAGFARLYQHILTEMDPGDRAVIVNALSSAEQRAADGFDQFFGLLGRGGQTYAKQGWMYYGDKLYLHSAGVVHAGGRDYVVVLMSIQAPVAAPARAALSAVATAALNVLTTSP